MPVGRSGARGRQLQRADEGDGGKKAASGAWVQRCPRQLSDTFPEALQGFSCTVHPPGLDTFLAAGYKNSLLHSNLMRCLKCGFNRSIKVTVTAFELVSANIFPEQTALLHPY